MDKNLEKHKHYTIQNQLLTEDKATTVSKYILLDTTYELRAMSRATTYRVTHAVSRDEATYRAARRCVT